MDDCDHEVNWQERLREELPAYAGFYLTALLWLWMTGMVQAWEPSASFVVLVPTFVIGVPVATLVSIMMVWRMFMVGIDSNSILGMVTAVGGACTLLAVSVSLAFPAHALGSVVGEAQRHAVAWLGSLL